MYIMSVGTEDKIYQLCRVSGFYLMVIMLVKTNKQWNDLSQIDRVQKLLKYSFTLHK